GRPPFARPSPSSSWRSTAAAPVDPGGDQPRPHPAPSAVQPTHDGPDRYAHHLRRLGVAQAVDIDELDHLTQPARERVERGFDLAVEHLADDQLLWRHRRFRTGLFWTVGIVEQFGTTTAGAIDLRVAHDRQQPRPRMAAVEAVHRLERPQQ